MRKFFDGADYYIFLQYFAIQTMIGLFLKIMMSDIKIKTCLTWQQL